MKERSVLIEKRLAFEMMSFLTKLFKVAALYQ